jgi:lysophospholipase L1-like esterase
MLLPAGLGGGGVFMTGFNVPVTFGPWLDTYMDQGPWNVVCIMIGINDLLRGGRSADDIMTNLKPMIEKVVAADTPVILMPPFAAPGFVQE